MNNYFELNRVNPKLSFHINVSHYSFSFKELIHNVENRRNGENKDDILERIEAMDLSEDASNFDRDPDNPTDRSYGGYLILKAYLKYILDISNGLSSEDLFDIITQKEKQLNYVAGIDTESFYDFLDMYYDDAVTILKEHKQKLLDYRIVELWFDMMKQYNEYFCNGIKVPINKHEDIVEELKIEVAQNALLQQLNLNNTIDDGFFEGIE